MSKLETITRYKLILNKLRKNPASFEEILSYLEYESEIEERNFTISKRTFQRDINEIFFIFNIEIVFDKSINKYKIKPAESDMIDTRMLEAFDTFNALSISERLSDYILFDNRKPQGTENFMLYLHAIKNCKYLQFEHQKFWEDELTIRKVAPYAVKEFKSRWYLVARDTKDDVIKTFGFDRISNLELLKESFEPVSAAVIQKKFENFYGVITPDEKQPEEIILEFDSEQIKYIASLSLHKSQRIEKVNDNVWRAHLHMVPAYDFEQELLSLANTVTIIKPKSLQMKIKALAEKIVKKY